MAAVARVRTIGSLNTLKEIQEYTLSLLSRKFTVSDASMCVPQIQALSKRLDSLFPHPGPLEESSIQSTKNGLGCIEKLFKAGVIDRAKLGTPLEKSTSPFDLILTTPEKTALFAKCFFGGGSIKKERDLSKAGHYGTVSLRHLKDASGAEFLDEDGTPCSFACKKPRKFTPKDFPSSLSAKDAADNIKHYNLQTETSLKNEEGILLALGPHKYIVTLHAILEEGMALEHAKETLEALEKRPITSVEFHTIAEQLFKALEYIHSKNIIHRDIKPSNILISQENELKICDFGAACFEKIQDYPIGTTTLFFAPECVTYQKSEPESALTTAVDIWAAGIVLYRLLTGRDHPCIVFHPKDKATGKDMKSDAFHAAYKEFLTSISSRGLADTGQRNYTRFEWTRVSIFEGLDLTAQTRMVDIDPTGCFRKLILNCLNVDRKKRPSAKKALEMLDSPALPGSAFYTPPATPQSSPQKPKEAAMPTREKPDSPKAPKGTPSGKRPATMRKINFSSDPPLGLDTSFALGARLASSPNPVRPSSRSASRLAAQFDTAFHTLDPEKSTDV